MNANIKGWCPALFPESDIACWNVFPFVSSTLSVTQPCWGSCGRSSLQEGFWGGGAQPAVEPGVIRVAASFQFFHAEQKRHPLWEGACRKETPLGRAISKLHASLQLVHPESGSHLVSTKQEGFRLSTRDLSGSFCTAISSIPGGVCLVLLKPCLDQDKRLPFPQTNILCLDSGLGFITTPFPPWNLLPLCNDSDQPRDGLLINRQYDVGAGKLQPMDKSGSLLIFTNKVLLRHSHDHSVFYLWLLS